MRQKRRNEDLAGAAEHLSYELSMLRETSFALQSGLFPAGIIRYALLGSFVVHARNLVHFLDPQNEKPSDVLAEDFVPSWSSERPAEPEGLHRLRGRTNKEVAHLTYDRLSVVQEQKGWQIHEITADINTRIDQLIALAPAGLLDSLKSDSPAS